VGTALLVDRRARHAQSAADSAGLILETQWVLPTPPDHEAVYAALLSLPTAAEPTRFPRIIVAGGVVYTRLVDRFYLPEDPGPELSSALFNIIAVDYDRLTKFELNRATAQRLLEELRLGGAGVRRILDFGCGTGVAVLTTAVCQGCGMDIVGTDASPAMLEIASERGEQTMALAEWRGLPDAAFDGAIAAFVLHYGIPVHDLIHIARQLRPGARFAANFFKPRPEATEALCVALAAQGLTLETREGLTSTNGENVLLVFIKTGSEFPR
jgi:ubiquinone/menaquinone biosynthesis C-methylase UbiE